MTFYRSYRGMFLAAAALAVSLISPAALAQVQQICIVEQNSGEVYCGRAASRSEISQSRYGRDRGGLRGSNGRATSQRNLSDLYDRLDDIYRDVLGRNIDSSGLRTYSRRLEQGWSLDQVRRDLAQSDEAEKALDELYQRILGRGIDPSGYETYSRKIARGASLRDVEQELIRAGRGR
ncbi:MAG: DUF4214 domain-containing protein [Synechococcales cyanobacterium RM1_1_8]|nr:DUF4214 domain-containing protein [Synechococcales cyanobacterium RM1_1_8]